MSEEIIAVIIGAIIGSISSLATTMLLSILKDRRRSKSIKAITAAEITAIKEKSQRYISGKSDKEELSASTPMLTSIVSEIGNMSPEQIIAFRRTVTLDMETRKSGSKEKAELTVQACEKALRLLLN